MPEAADPATIGGVVGAQRLQRVQATPGRALRRIEIHHYYFRVFALDVHRSGVASGASREAVDAAMSGHVLAEGALVGTFSH